MTLYYHPRSHSTAAGGGRLSTRASSAALIAVLPFVKISQDFILDVNKDED